jgi:hypothetical protein
MSLSFLYIYICYNFTFDDYKYCCVEVHDQHKYELPDITDIFSFNFSTADSWIRSRIVSGREGGGGRLRGSGINQTNSMSFFLPLSTYTLNILGLGEGVCGGPNKCINTIFNGIVNLFTL